MRSEYEANKSLEQLVQLEQRAKGAYAAPSNRELLNERKPIRPEEKPVVNLADPSNPSTWALA